MIISVVVDDEQANRAGNAFGEQPTPARSSGPKDDFHYLSQYYADSPERVPTLPAATSSRDTASDHHRSRTPTKPAPIGTPKNAPTSSSQSVITGPDNNDYPPGKYPPGFFSSPDVSQTHNVYGPPGLGIPLAGTPSPPRTQFIFPIPKGPGARSQENMTDAELMKAGLVLYVIGIHYMISEGRLTRMFSRFGEVTKCELAIHEVTGESCGFGVIVMGSATAAKNAHAAFHGETIEGVRMNIEIVQHKDSVAAGPASLQPDSIESVHSGPVVDERFDKITDVHLLLEQPPTEELAAAISTQASSWATLASKDVPEYGKLNMRGVIPTSSEPRPRNIARLRPVGRIPSIEAARASRKSISRNVESIAGQNRVIFILSLPQHITLRKVSDAISEGPIASIRFGTNADDASRYVGIVFQNAWDAGKFYVHMQQEHKRQQPPYRLGFLADVLRGDPHPADDSIRAMAAPVYARRRLTIVKSKLFFLWKKSELETLCNKHVGEENVQMVHLYNGGNATVCFAGVEAAIKIKSLLTRMAHDKGRVWEGMYINYSKDPCEAELRFLSDLPSSGGDSYE